MADYPLIVKFGSNPAEWWIPSPEFRVWIVSETEKNLLGWGAVVARSLPANHRFTNIPTWGALPPT